ncbi:MAG TPA: MFS transporter, partial [Tepiditoga sp.]|nr:MFS transporter [Tepiditoga sp.]
YNKTMKFAVLEGATYNGFYIGTQGFIITAIALYFGAGPFELSVISSIPVVAQMMQIFTPYFHKLTKSKKSSLMLSAFIARNVILFIPAFIIFKFKNPYLLILIMATFSFIGAFTGNIWTGAMKKIIPPESRGKYFGVRNVFSSFVSIIMTAVYSNILNSENESKILTVTLIMAVLAISTIIMLYFHDIPEEENETRTKIDLKTPFKDPEYKVFLKFVIIWTFTIEFTRPFFSYYQIDVLNVSYKFLGNLSILSGIISLVLYMFYGKLVDKFGNKNVLIMGIAIASLSPFIFFIASENNYKSIFMFESIFSAVAWTAINLAFFNLLLETSKEPAENYVGAYAFVSGISAICASLLGGISGNLMKGKYFYILGDKYHGIQIMFLIGFILRIYSLLNLTNVKAFEKPFRYEGFLFNNASSSRRREVEMPSYLRIFKNLKK